MLSNPDQLHNKLKLHPLNKVTKLRQLSPRGKR